MITEAFEAGGNYEFSEKGYKVIRNFIPKDFCNFITSYFRIRQDSLDYKIDNQCPRSKSFYGDPLIETILFTGCKRISQEINIELYPTYSYARVYGKGEHLVTHLDRPECQYSATLSLGYSKDEGPSSIFMSKDNDKDTAAEVILEPGDLCIYKGNEVYHWREPFKHSWYLQAFLHYVDQNGPYSNRLYDGRRSLAIPRG